MEMWTSKWSGLRIRSIGVRCTRHWSSAFWSCWQAIGSSGRIAQLVFCGVRGSSCTFSRGGLLPQAAQKLADSVWSKGRKTEPSFATRKSFSDSSSRHVSRLARSVSDGYRVPIVEFTGSGFHGDRKTPSRGTAVLEFGASVVYVHTAGCCILDVFFGSVRFGSRGAQTLAVLVGNGLCRQYGRSCGRLRANQHTLRQSMAGRYCRKSSDDRCPPKDIASLFFKSILIPQWLLCINVMCWTPG